MSFRSVDIDRLDPDSVVNYVPEVEPSGVTLNDVQQIAAEVRSAVQSGDATRAVKVAVSRPPYGSDETTKEAALAAVLQALVSVRVSDVNGVLKALDTTEKTVLTKYLFKAMSVPEGQKNGAILLQWADRTFAQGQGPIIRHITDRRTI